MATGSVNIADYLAELDDAGPTESGDRTFSVRSGTPFSALPGRIGYAPYKDLVWDDEDLGIKFYDKVTDRGYIIGSKGDEVNIIQVPNYVTDPIDIDPDLGAPFFYVWRLSNAVVVINGAPGTNRHPGPDALVADRDPLAIASDLTGVSSAVVGDCAYVTADECYYVLTTTGPSTLGHWTALPVGAPGLMTVTFDFEGEIPETVLPVMCMFAGPNQLRVG